MASPELSASSSVELRAKKDGSSLVLQLSRPAAEDRVQELRAEGWAVDIVQVGEPPPVTAAVRQRRLRALRSHLGNRLDQMSDLMRLSNRCVEANWEHLNRTRMFVDQWKRRQTGRKRSHVDS